MSEINNPRAWVEKAEEDFALAQSALGHKKPLVTGGCFHTQQCVEIDTKLLNTLTDYAVRTRYPGQGPTASDAKEAMEIAKLIRKFARGFLGI